MLKKNLKSQLKVKILSLIVILSLVVLIGVIVLADIQTELFFEDWEDNDFVGWSNSGWTMSTTQKIGSYGVECATTADTGNICGMHTTASIDTSSLSNINVSYWYSEVACETGDGDVYFKDNLGNWDLMGDFGVWNREELVFYSGSYYSEDPQYLHSGFAVGFNSSLLKKENVFLDNINVTGITSEDTCTYTSGNWIVDCSDNCTISSPVDLQGNDIILTGTGRFRIEDQISNFGRLTKSDGCRIELILGSGGKIVK